MAEETNKADFSEDRQNAVYMLQNYLKKYNDMRFNANILICADTAEQAYKFADTLTSSIKTDEDFAGYIDEDKMLSDYKPPKVTVIRNYKGKKLDDLYTKLKDVEKNEWNTAVIICTTMEVATKIQDYAADDHRLYYYLCGLKIKVSDVAGDNITDVIFPLLSSKRFKLSDEFKKDLSLYVKAVYPEAILKDDAFITDLYNRIIQKHYQKQDCGDELDASDVPNSEKAEKMKKELAEKKKLDEIKITETKFMETQFDKIEEADKNVLILSMSTLNSRNTSYYYSLEKEGFQTYTGVSQLEVGTKFFISKLAKQGRKSDKIIIFTTLESTNRAAGGSAVDVYSKNILKYIKNECKDEGTEKYDDALGKKYNVKKVIYDTNITYDRCVEPFNQQVFSEELKELNYYIDVQIVQLNEESLINVSSILHDLADKNHVNLFVDLQGGARTFIFTLFATLTLFRDKNVTLRDLFATKYDRNKDINPIEIVTNEYAIIDLVSGIRAFTHYGKVDELKKFIDSRNVDKDNERELLKILEDIDGNMQINNPDGFTRELNLLNYGTDGISILDKTDYDRQFQLIVNDLKNVYAPLLAPNHSVLDQIKWFGDKAFITSALTFIEDKIPAFMLKKENKIIRLEYDKRKKTDRDICKEYHGQSYYKVENNLFNAVFNCLVEDNRKKFLRKVAEDMADKIIAKLKTKSVKVKGESVVDKLNVDNDWFKEIEGAYKEKVWENIKEEKLNELCGKKGGRKTKLDKLPEYKKNDRLDLDGIYKKFEPLKQLDEAKVDVVKQYLKMDNNFDCTNPIDKKILKSMISTAVFKIIYSDYKNNDGKKSVGFINDILIRCIELSNPDKLNNSDYNGHYNYTVWMDILKEIDIGYEKIVSDFECNTSNEADKKRFSDIMDDFELEETDKAKLVDFAEAYTGYRNLIDNMGHSKKYELCNPELYCRLESTYEDIYKMFFVEKLPTVAGLKEDTYDGWLKLSFCVEPSKLLEKRQLLNTCILFYQALKHERNATNHAEDKDDGHMPYQYTRKAVNVFVKLCEILQKDY